MLVRNKLYTLGIAIMITGVFVAGSMVIGNDGLDEQASDIELDEEHELTFIKKFSECGTKKQHDQDSPPEPFEAIDFTGRTKEEVKDKLPNKWGVLEFSEDELVLKYSGEYYSNYEEKTAEDDGGLFNGETVGYIGIHLDNIAIYKGEPPKGELVEVTRYEVKDVYREELRKGILFESEEEMEKILESYTS